MNSPYVGMADVAWSAMADTRNSCLCQDFRTQAQGRPASIDNLAAVDDTNRLNHESAPQHVPQMPAARWPPPAFACLAGAYEIHVTLQPLDGNHRLLETFAAQLGCSFVDIELDHGLHPLQPMLTRRMHGTWPEARRHAAALAQAVRRAGMAVRRIKIEIGIDHPAASREAGWGRKGAGYFEHHVRLRLADDDDLAALRRYVEPFAAHLSRNARRPSLAGRHERFVTQRCQGVACDEAGRRLDELLGSLAAIGIEVIGCDREYVIHDGRPGLDAGWADAAIAEHP